MERTSLICYMLGAIGSSRKFEVKSEDALILLDQILNDMKQLPITNEEKKVILEMHEQMEIFNIQMGLNRSTQRKIGLHRR